jgi:PAS domain S-box-containing protein
MRLKSQYIVSIIIFGILLIIISASVIVTNQQVAQINNKEQIAGIILTGASNLAYISNDYFLYQQNAQLYQWQNQFSSLSSDLSKLTPNGPAQQSQINNVNTDLQNLGSVFNSSVSFIESTPRNESIRVLPAFQTDWDRLALQNQALTFDASVLSKSFGDQTDQLKQTNNILTLGLIGAFGAYFVAIYFIIYRRTLRSIAKLQDGTKIIGSGNLDYSVDSKSNDEVGELSRAFNQMTSNLKTVTASKASLEEEIAERKEVEEKLQSSNQRTIEILESIQDNFYSLDRKWNFVYVNNQASILLGSKPENLIGRNIWEVFPKASGTPFEENYRAAMDKREIRRFETHGKYADSWLMVTVFPSVEGISAWAADITERKKAEEALATATNRLAQELTGSLRLQELSMIFVSQDNIQVLLDKIVFAAIEIMHADMGNMQQITGEGDLKIVAQSGFKQPFLDFFNCVGTDSHAACSVAMASKERIIISDVTQSPIFLNTPSLDVLLEAGVRAVVSTPFFTRSGEFLGVISTHYRTAREPDEFDLRLLDLLVRQAADFVERTQTKQKLEDYAKNLALLVEERTKQLRDAERLATIGATAGMVGHDIRNPLQAITGDVYLAKTELASIPESEEKNSALESLQEIEKNTDYINKIVQDLQDFARPLKPNVEEVDLKLIIEDLLKKIGLPKNVKVSVKVESDARKIVADSTFVNRVMYNLVNNAVQAMPKGGKLTIHSYKEANDVLITVKDTGVGIPEAVKGKLFTPMFTTKAKGQGFGLPVIKRMTEALGGTVTFESEEDKGTTFILRLPPPKK